MEKQGKSLFGGMKIVGNFYSAAARQGREPDIDVPSKRRYRLMYGSGNDSFAPPMDAGTGLGGDIVRAKIGRRAFLDCLIDAKNRVERSRADASTRRFYQKLPE